MNCKKDHILANCPMLDFLTCWVLQTSFCMRLYGSELVNDIDISFP